MDMLFTLGNLSAISDYPQLVHVYKYTFTMHNSAMDSSEYVASILRPMLRHPESFNIISSQDEMGELLTVDLHKLDMGMVIGKNGQTIGSIRHLVRVQGMGHGSKVSIKINEPR